MFTGIIQTVGRVRSLERTGRDARLQIEVAAGYLDGVAIGDSIAVAGACLTAVSLEAAAFAADVSRETLDCTSLGHLIAGSRVNLERALAAGAPLGGHFVTGHVDGVGRLLERRRDARSERMRFEIPEPLAPLVAPKGSITIEGVSLTVNAASGRELEVNLVPHTLAETTLGDLAAGDPVNVEADLLARYLARLLSVSGYNRRIDRDFLARHGYGESDR